MTEQNEIRNFIFSKKMPNGDTYYYEEQFLLDVFTGVEESIMVKLVGVRPKGQNNISAPEANQNKPLPPAQVHELAALAHAQRFFSTSRFALPMT